MRVLVTGSDGFVGRNLCVRLRELPHFEVICIDRASSESDLSNGLSNCDFVFHLAGVNRPPEPSEFMVGNRDLTARLARILAPRGGSIPIVFSSSAQADRDNPYGLSKRAAEQTLIALFMCFASRTSSVNGVAPTITLRLLLFATTSHAVCRSRLTIQLQR